MSLRLGSEIEAALHAGVPVVALESTIFSTLGLPAPHNEAAFDRVRTAISATGAIAALTGVIDGEAVVGCDEHETARLLQAHTKVAARDLGLARAARLPAGVTTVSSTLALAQRSGIDVMATGGIGGVHRDVPTTGDVSADLYELARCSVVTVSAGAKAFLDLGRTLELLDTLGVAVLGWRCDEFPAFWSRGSGLGIAWRVEEPEAVADGLYAQRDLGRAQGLLVAVPVPADAEVPRAEIEPIIAEALASASQAGLTGGAVTPFVLAAIGERTEGRAVAANLALAEHNAAVAAAIAAATAKLRAEIP